VGRADPGADLSEGDTGSAALVRAGFDPGSPTTEEARSRTATRAATWEQAGRAFLRRIWAAQARETVRRSDLSIERTEGCPGGAGAQVGVAPFAHVHAREERKSPIPRVTFYLQGPPFLVPSPDTVTVAVGNSGRVEGSRVFEDICEGPSF
jgi:hypothetical protein